MSGLILILALLASIHCKVFIPASSPSVWSVGRTLINGDGSLSFDWEGTQFYINVKKASYVNIHIKASGSASGRFLAHVNGWEATSFFVSAGQEEFVIATGIPDEASQIRVISVLEPALESVNQNSFFTFLGFSTDGTVLPASQQRPRRIELVGDSISAGYGSRGYQGAPSCPITGYTCGNPYTYNWYLAEFFNADIHPIAWSGKGMYVNCCDNGETMPSYYLQTLGGRAYSTDWDFNRYVPDMMLINLGTNDFNHDSGPSWRAIFTQTYVDFVINATTRYKKPQLPVFVAQGPMNCKTVYTQALQNAVKGINSRGGNAIFLDMCGPVNDGCNGHPGVQGHIQMFEKATPVISSHMNWNADQDEVQNYISSLSNKL